MGILELVRKHRTWGAMLLVTVLVFIGIINLRNADHYSNDTYHYNQVIWIIVASVMAIFAAFVDLRLFERLALPVYLLLLACLVLVPLVGVEVNNARRWLAVPLTGLRFQPSELAKVSLILLMARHFQAESSAAGLTLRSALKPIAMGTVPFLLVLLQPDLGTSILLAVTTLSVLLYRGMRLRSFLILVGVFLLILPIAWHYDLVRGYQKERIQLWLHPDSAQTAELRAAGKNLQPEQALWAIGSGGFTGKGSRRGLQSRLKFLPEMQTDFIVATLGEERGFLGCTFVLALYFALVSWGMGVARGAREKFGSLAAAGLTAMIFWQVFMNVGMVLGLLPVVGVTLPFMSYGGSSLISTMVGVGLLVNIDRHKGRV